MSFVKHQLFSVTNFYIVDKMGFDVAMVGPT